MKAIILGATGAVGRDLTEMLLKDDYFGQVDIFVRREVNAVHPKLKVHVVDFDHPENWQDQVHGDVVFSCMGTNRKAAGSTDRTPEEDDMLDMMVNGGKRVSLQNLNAVTEWYKSVY